MYYNHFKPKKKVLPPRVVDTKDVLLKIRVNHNLLKRIDERAKDNRTTRSNYVRNIIENQFDSLDKAEWESETKEWDLKRFAINERKRHELK